MVVILDFVEMDGALSCARVDAAERRNPHSTFHQRMTSPILIMLTSMAEPTFGSAGAAVSHNSSPITVIAIDHNPILLEGIEVLIRNQSDMRLLGTATGAGKAVALHLKTSPDITVIDLELPNSTAYEAIRHILLANPRAKLIGLTTYEFDRFWPEALAAGVVAVIAKDRIGEDLVSLIRRTLGATT
jgi:CheY-like chemotaxis protein